MLGKYIFEMEETFMLNSKEMARIAYDALDEKLGKDIRIIKIDEISVIADYLIIANGNNSPQITAMLDNVELKMHENGIESNRTHKPATTPVVPPCSTLSWVANW